MQAMEEDPADPCIEYVHSDTGLYPLPLARNAKSSHRTKMKNKFQFLGKFIAKAVLDNRMVDLPFSQPFYQWLLKEDATLSTRDLLNIDPTIANTVSQLEGIVRKKRRLEEDDKVRYLLHKCKYQVSMQAHFIKDMTSMYCTYNVQLKIKPGIAYLTPTSNPSLFHVRSRTPSAS